MKKSSKNSFSRFVLIFLVFLTMPVIPEATESIPEYEIVERLHQKLTYIMKNAGTLGYQGRVSEISETISNGFNVPLIAQVILGRYWSGLDESQKSVFISLYEKLIIATYASRFDNYSGETFATKSVEEMNRGRKLVKTELIQSSGEIVSLDYLISQHENKWMIISVIANGANDISIKRGEYSDIIKMHGFDALLNLIRNKIDETAEI